jgi:hypothetical protein
MNIVIICFWRIFINISYFSIFRSLYIIHNQQQQIRSSKEIR